jgi:hypothetical protein
MSSPKAAAAKAAHKAAHRNAPKERSKERPKPAARAKRTAPTAATPTAPGGAGSAEALRLAAEIESMLADGRLDLLAPEALQALMGAACKAYAAQVEAGNPMAALGPRTTVTPTEVMVTASGLLRAANLAVFELGMWQSWTGR